MLNPYRAKELLNDPAWEAAAFALNLSGMELEEKLKEDQLTVKEIRIIAMYCELDYEDVQEIFFYEPLQERVSKNIARISGDEYSEIKELALAAGLNPRLLYRKMADMQPFDLNELDALCQALNVSIDDLIHGMN